MNLADASGLAEQLDGSTGQISQPPDRCPIDLPGILASRQLGSDLAHATGPTLGTYKVTRLGATPHERGESQTRGDGNPGKELDRPGFTRRDESDGGVESSETGETSRDKEQEAGDIERETHTEGVCQGSRGDTERDLLAERSINVSED